MSKSAAAAPNFWQKLSRPIFVLAPMADVTDCAFRSVIAKYGKPDVTWTEFVSADGLARAPKEGQEKLLKDLIYTEAERPIVAQFFTSNPENMRAACIRARELGFDGVDINMGCPDKSIEKQGAGACMMKNPEAARAVIRAAKESGLPVSVKTRIGYNKNQIDTWIPEILAERPAVLTIHARTRKEMSLVPARFEHVAEVVQLRDCMNEEALARGEEPIETLIFGNGDVTDLVCARKRVEETGCDGIMLGRAIFGNPWLFSKQNREAVVVGDLFVPTIKERLNVMLEHTKLFVELLGDFKNFAIMKKHYKAYVNGFDGAKELRVKLMEAGDFNEIEKIVKDFLAEFK